MALDEILFEESELTGVGFLRLSVFNPAAATLGYFQTSKNRDLSDSSWTRRPTGGGIVEHQGDLILSLSHLWPQKRKQASLVYQQIHEALRRALAAVTANPDLSLVENCPPCSSKANESYCFKSPVQYDICSPQGKIVGGALGRKRKAFLYQGAIRVDELLSSVSTRDTFQKHVGEVLKNIWDVSYEENTFSQEQKSRAEELEKNKYLTPAWKGKY